jgi:hypothetical protein
MRGTEDRTVQSIRNDVQTSYSTGVSPFRLEESTLELSRADLEQIRNISSVLRIMGLFGRGYLKAYVHTVSS